MLPVLQPALGLFRGCFRNPSFDHAWKRGYGIKHTNFVYYGQIVAKIAGETLIDVTVHIMNTYVTTFCHMIGHVTEWAWKKGQEPMTRSLQLYCVRVRAFSQTDLFLDWISREWDSHRSPMTNYKKLSWRHRVTEPELPLFFDLIRGNG